MVGFGKYLVLAFACLVLGIVIGKNVDAQFLNNIRLSLKENSQKKDDIRKTLDGEAKFTSPLLECAELPESVQDVVLDRTRSDLEKLLSRYKSSRDIENASVYFRDLNNGPWFGIDESINYFPASLLKLPLAMSYYDRAEDDTNLLFEEVVYTPDPSVTSQAQPFGTQEELTAGKKYTVQYLLDMMLKESNNEAANTLAVYGGEDIVDNVYKDLGLNRPENGKDYSISTHRYASFFRILYNATYVDRVASEKILAALSEAAFSGGLVAGVPHGVHVSHKYGTRRVDDVSVQLHDCGIVYAPNNPYILCVMTRGSDFDKLANVVKEISSVVYRDVIIKGK